MKNPDVPLVQRVQDACATWFEAYIKFQEQYGSLADPLCTAMLGSPFGLAELNPFSGVEDTPVASIYPPDDQA